MICLKDAPCIVEYKGKVKGVIMTVQSTQEGLWVLGYGSLIYKPPPNYDFRIPCYVHSYSRRFWQSSTDHRGTEEFPGRVATLVKTPNSTPEPSTMINDSSISLSLDEHSHCQDDYMYAVVYYISPTHSQSTRHNLDVREKGGYDLLSLPCHITKETLTNINMDPLLFPDLIENSDSKSYTLHANVYVGGPECDEFIGPELITDTAKVISAAVGPSGTNYEYLYKLCKALEELGGCEKYLHDLLEHVETLMQS